MPSQARIGDTFATGHACTGTSTIASGSSDVLANKIGCARLGDKSASHTILVGDDCVPHVVSITSGSPTVLINKRKSARVGDSIDAGSITSGSSDVILDSGKQALGILYPDVFYNVDMGLTKQHVHDIKEGAGDVKEPEPAEYGDGGITNGDGEYNKPNVDIEGTVGVGEPATESNDKSTTPAEIPEKTPQSGPGLVFLPHTDPRILPEVRNRLVKLSERLGRELVITSAYRSPEYNKRVKGAKKSTHVQGKAVDIVQRGWSIKERQEFIQAAYAEGLTGIGIYDTFTHVDIGGKRAWGAPNSWRHLYKFPWAQEVLQPLGYRVR